MDSDDKTLHDIAEAEKFRQRWLSDYIRYNQGFFFDRILNRWCGRVLAGVTTTRRFT